MKIDKITRTLIGLSIIAIFLDLARGNLLGANGLLYLIWNLFLAWIPYFISVCFIKKEMPAKHFIPIFILWLLFFPNAPYLVTDVLHIAGRLTSLLWYDSLLFFFFGWIGLFLGILSLAHIHEYLKSRFSYSISEIIIFSVCVVSSFGIYLGRFERWNSWDIFLNPFKLMQHSINIGTHLSSTSTPLLFVIVFTVFMYATYKKIQVLMEAKK